MFQSLSQKLTDVFDKLRKRGVLSAADIDNSLREIRIALLEADVALPVVKDLIAKIKVDALGEAVVKGINPAQMIVKIVHDKLIEALGKDTQAINLSAPAPFSILLAGLQGAGKTTTAAKLAKFLTNQHHKKVLLVSLDIYRPAAMEQLAILGQQLKIETLPIVPNEKPLAIAERAINFAKVKSFDVILFDTAGRLHIDDALMTELTEVKDFVKPIETFLVADAMLGQDAANIALQFNQLVGLSGIILTRVDGDGRGGAALSMRYVTNCPIKFLGVGEKTDQLEIFDAKRLADRILDMGDVVALVDKAKALIDTEDTEALAKRLESGSFDFNDMVTHLRQMEKMGGVSGFLSMLPGVGKIKDQLESSGLGEKIIKKNIAIVMSMTPKERRDYRLLNASRKKRIATGAGVSVNEINMLIKQFQQMQGVVKKMGKIGAKGLMRGGMGGIGRLLGF